MDGEHRVHQRGRGGVDRGVGRGSGRDGERRRRADERTSPKHRRNGRGLDIRDTVLGSAESVSGLHGEKRMVEHEETRRYRGRSASRSRRLWLGNLDGSCSHS